MEQDRDPREKIEMPVLLSRKSEGARRRTIVEKPKLLAVGRVLCYLKCLTVCVCAIRIKTSIYTQNRRERKDKFKSQTVQVKKGRKKILDILLIQGWKSNRFRRMP
jgi:hypothetical protein